MLWKWRPKQCQKDYTSGEWSDFKDRMGVSDGAGYCYDVDGGEKEVAECMQHYCTIRCTMMMIVSGLIMAMAVRLFGLMRITFLDHTCPPRRISEGLRSLIP